MHYYKEHDHDWSLLLDEVNGADGGFRSKSYIYIIQLYIMLHMCKLGHEDEWYLRPRVWLCLRLVFSGGSFQQTKFKDQNVRI